MGKLLVVIGVLVAVACSAPPEETIAMESAEAALAPLDLESSSDTGKYLAVVTSQRSQVVTAVSRGTVDALLVNIGDRVEVGQELVQLDMQELRSELEVALAAQSSAMAARSKAAIEVDEAARQVALSKRLYRDQVRSRESVNQASFGLKRSRANLREFGGVAKQRSTQIAELRKRLSQSGMTATMAGVVSSVEVQTGSTVQRGQRLLRIIAPDDLAVRFAIPTSELGSVSIGDEVTMTHQGLQIPLSVVSVSPDIDPGLQLAFALAVPKTRNLLHGVTPGTVANVRRSESEH